MYNNVIKYREQKALTLPEIERTNMIIGECWVEHNQSVTDDVAAIKQ